MGGRDWARWAPLTGVIFAVLLFVGAMVGGNTPDSDATAQHTVSYFMSHRGSQQASVFLIVYSVVFGLFFGAAVRSYLRARLGGDGLSMLGFAGMIILATSACVITGIDFAATDVPGKISPAAEQALNVLQNDVFFGMLVGAGVFLLVNGFAIATNAAAAIPRWLGWVAVLLGVIALTPLGWISLIFALPLWSLIVGVLMFLRQRAPAPAAPAPATG
jgi:hypothetical protein